MTEEKQTIINMLSAITGGTLSEAEYDELAEQFIHVTNVEKDNRISSIEGDLLRIMMLAQPARYNPQGTLDSIRELTTKALKGE